MIQLVVATLFIVFVTVVPVFVVVTVFVVVAVVVVFVVVVVVDVVVVAVVVNPFILNVFGVMSVSEFVIVVVISAAYEIIEGWKVVRRRESGCHGN